MINQEYIFVFVWWAIGVSMRPKKKHNMVTMEKNN